MEKKLVSSALDLCTLAWSDQQGYVALSLRDPTVDKSNEGYWKDVIFKWPNDKDRIAETLQAAKDARHDVYWAPAVFNAPTRTRQSVGRVSSLWADLDEVDPNDLPKSLKPTAAWETSPGRWQALWTLDHAIKADSQTKLNQRLTYAIGADKGGWDLTQVLRTPGTPNHKYKDLPTVKMLWLNGHSLAPEKLVDDLPEVNLNGQTTPLGDAKAVLRKHKLNGKTKRLLNARHAQVGTRSDTMWYLMQLLAEQGLTAEEVVTVVKHTVWNKFAGRHDELTSLTREATKAVDKVGLITVDEGEDESEELEEVEDVEPQRWDEFDRQHKAIRWLVADVWGESEVGFISGLPKSYKSWLALDFAVSIATGTRFLGVFQTRKANVLLVQEEDPRPVLQDRLVKVAASKDLVYAKVTGKTMEVRYELPDNLFIISNQGFTLDEEWLDQLEEWIKAKDIKIVILDPLMMIAGAGFDEFKAFEFMEKVLKPLKRLRARTQAAIVLVHHHLKSSTDAGARQMYGSVALWAWEEAALHLQVTGVGKVVAERFSKHALLPPISIEVGDLSDVWQPQTTIGGGDSISLFDLLSTMEAGATVKELEVFTGMSRDVITRQLKALSQADKIKKSGSKADGPGRPQTIWKVL